MAEYNDERSDINWISTKQPVDVSRTAALSKADNNAIDTDLDFEHDPDLMVEIEIPVQSTDRTEVYSRYQKGSASTTKAVSAKSARSTTSSANKMTSRPLTRGRPIKSHEPEPFLSVDTISPDKLQAQIKSARSSAKNEKQKEKRSRTPLISTNQNLPFWAGAKSPYSSPIPPRSASRISGCRTPASMMYVSPNQESKRNNPHVRSPFKHAVNKPETPLDTQHTPGAELKEMTAIATYHIGRVLAKEKVEQKKRHQGKLLKGKLKPLKLVKVSGPNIQQCRGICAEMRPFGTSASRTLERRKQLIQTIPNVHEYLYDRPRTVESIHRTSEASSVDENRDNKDTVFDEALNTDRLPEHGAVFPEPTAPPTSSATNYKPSEPSSGATPLSRTFVTEIRSAGGSRGNEVDRTSSAGILTKGQPTQDSIQTSGDHSKRPSTAGTRSHGSEDSTPRRPNTAGDKSKSVRFADNISSAGKTSTDKEIKDMKNTQIINEKNRKNDETDTPENVSKKEKQEIIQDSCKSDEKDFSRDKDDDDDENKGGNNGNSQGSRVQGSGNFVSNTGSTQGSNNNKEENKSKSGETGGKKQNMFLGGTNDLSIGYGSSADLTVGLKTPYVPNSPKSPKINKEIEPKLVCSRQRENSLPDSKHINTLQIQTVLQAGEICHVVGPESPHRSRSPSPNRGQRAKVKSEKPDKTNKLVRPSSANIKSRQKRKGSSRRNSESKSSECLASRRSKVHFEGEPCPRPSLFTESNAGEEIIVGLKEDRTLTFDEIEAELSALQQEIQERQEFKAVDRPMSVASSCDQKSDISDVETGSPQETDRESVKTEIYNLNDFTELLDVYRKRCMDVSERCGVISGALTTPRTCRYTPDIGRRPDSGKSKRKEMIYQKASLQYKSDQNIGYQSSVTGMETDQEISHAISELSLADSGFSMDSTVSAQKDDRLGGLDPMSDSCSDLCMTDRTKEGEEEGNTKPLLEIVCDELQSVQQNTDEEKPKKSSVKTEVELQVVAEAKVLSKSRQSGKEKTTPTPPFAPVCFTINARPPTGYIYYFAYGSDMNSTRLSTYIHRKVATRFWGLLFGFNLVFNKRGCDTEAGGFANIEFNPFCSTEGCIYQITPEELELLDNCIGYPTHYEHLMVPVWMSNSDDPDQYSVGQYCVPALTYIAQDKWIAKEDEKLDCDYVVSQCVKGSDLLTDNYKNHLESLRTPITVQT